MGIRIDADRSPNTILDLWIRLKKPIEISVFAAINKCIYRRFDRKKVNWCRFLWWHLACCPSAKIWSCNENEIELIMFHIFSRRRKKNITICWNKNYHPSIFCCGIDGSYIHRKHSKKKKIYHSTERDVKFDLSKRTEEPLNRFTSSTHSLLFRSHIRMLYTYSALLFFAMRKLLLLLCSSGSTKRVICHGANMLSRMLCVRWCERSIF